jgi:hypothetical protein
MDAEEAPDGEIEITPEMIEAGVTAYCEFESDDPPEWVASAVYRAMLRASPRPSC